MTPLRIAAVSAFALAAAFSASTASARQAAGLTITPAPAKTIAAEGAFWLSAATRIHVPKADAEARGVATQLADLIQRSRGFRPAVVEGAPPPGAAAIVLTREGPGGEAYKLDIGPKAATIAAPRPSRKAWWCTSRMALATRPEQ